MWCTKSAPGTSGARAGVARAARAGMLALCIGNPTNLASNCLYLHTTAGASTAAVVRDQSRPCAAQIANLIAVCSTLGFRSVVRRARLQRLR